MKTATLVFVLILFLTAPFTVLAGGSTQPCATKYPVVLSKGCMARLDNLGIPFWWDIPDRLAGEGASVYLADQPAFDTTENNARYLKRFVLEVKAVSGASKVNVIGIDTGVTDARHMISNLGMASSVASLSGCSGNYRGSLFFDTVLGILPDTGEQIIAAVFDLWARLVGDENPDSLPTFYGMTREHMTGVFNPNTPDAPGVYYQSWTGAIKYITVDKLNCSPAWALMLILEGENCGWFSTTTSKWGYFRGAETGPWWSSGVSHENLINHLLGGYWAYDAAETFIEVVSDLKDMGY